MAASSGLLLIGLTIGTVWATIILVYRRTLLRLWREPVLRRPVLIIESDDWGPGPDAHVAALKEVVAVLQRHRDAAGRPAMMTIGAVLAVPDNKAIRDSGLRRYARQTLIEPRFEGMRRALIAGRDRGVLAVQLHGMEHLWPDALIMAAAGDDRVRQWMNEADGFDTEALPAPIQSRWIDASVLPSRPLRREAIEAAVFEEVRVFQHCFRESPRVAVPPTFVWNSYVEQAWAEQGVRVVMTPGRRLTLRDQDGVAGGRDKAILNGDLGEGEIVYLVRDIYFEPTLGHTAEEKAAEVEQRFELGRPALLETHRFNFVGARAQRDQALGELEHLLNRLLERFPALRFISSAELATALATRDPHWVEARLTLRLMAWLRRAAAIHRLRKLAWLTGLGIPASLIFGAAQFAYTIGTNRAPGSARR